MALKGVKLKCGRCHRWKKDCPCGRRPVLTKEVTNKLIEGLRLGMPMAKACDYAGISDETVRVNRKKDAKLNGEIRSALYYFTNIARISVLKHMPNDGALALKVLEKKESNEFKNRNEITGEDGEAINVNFVNEAKKRSKRWADQ